LRVFHGPSNSIAAGAALNEMKFLQTLFRSFPQSISGDFNPRRLQPLLQKGLGVDRAAFLVPGPKGLEAPGEGVFRPSRRMYRRLEAEGKPWTAAGSRKGRKAAWSGFWPVKIRGVFRGCWALGFRRDGSPPEGETQRLMELVALRTGFSMEGLDLFQRLERVQRLSQAGSLSVLLMHEIKNYLTPLSTFAQLLPLKWGDEGFRSEFPESFSRAVDRIMGLTEGVLDFSRAPGGSFKPLEWGPVLEKAGRLLSPLFRARGVRLEIRSDPGLWMPGEEGQILSLAVNLVQNALQASKSGGKVLVRARQTGGRPAYLLFSVQDEGKGIALENVPKVFEAFFTDREAGTGLGLFLCRRIVENHGGILRAGNRSPRGAVFTARFPLLKA
jgi:signal transduction histidine kinase